MATFVYAIVLIFVAVAGCGSDIDVADLGTTPRQDLAVCTQGVGAPSSVATPCGPLTCAPGQICVAHQPGAPPGPDLAQPSDGGLQDGGSGGFDPYYHSCLVLPAECQRCGGCGDGTVGAAGKQFGCFASICPPNSGFEEVGCAFDGATLTCFGL